MIMPRGPHFVGAIACTIGMSLLLSGCAQAAAYTPLTDVIRNAETAKLNATDPPANYVKTGDAATVRQLMLDRANANLARGYL